MWAVFIISTQRKYSTAVRLCDIVNSVLCTSIQLTWLFLWNIYFLKLKLAINFKLIYLEALRSMLISYLSIILWLIIFINNSWGKHNRNHRRWRACIFDTKSSWFAYTKTLIFSVKLTGILKIIVEHDFIRLRLVIVYLIQHVRSYCIYY